MNDTCHHFGMGLDGSPCFDSCHHGNRDDNGTFDGLRDGHLILKKSKIRTKQG